MRQKTKQKTNSGIIDAAKSISGKALNALSKILPFEFSAVSALASLAKARKAQSSLEYIMMISAASIVIVLALAMVLSLKGAAMHSIAINGSNVSVSQAISQQLNSLSSNAI